MLDRIGIFMKGIYLSLARLGLVRVKCRDWLGLSVG